MGERVVCMQSGSGLHLLLGVRDDRSCEELIALAQAGGVRVYDTRRYWLQTGDNPSGKPSGNPNDSPSANPLHSFVLLGFSAIAEDAILPGIKALANAWFG
jgi:GntR family transcriptional regulator/MocR family aminotransferase